MAILDQVTEQQQVVMKITLHANGALSVEGPVHDKPFCLAMLDHARDAIKNHRKPGLVMPPRDVQLPDQKVYGAP